MFLAVNIYKSMLAFSEVTNQTTPVNTTIINSTAVRTWLLTVNTYLSDNIWLCINDPAKSANSNQQCLEWNIFAYQDISRTSRPTLGTQHTTKNLQHNKTIKSLSSTAAMLRFNSSEPVAGRHAQRPTSVFSLLKLMLKVQDAAPNINQSRVLEQSQQTTNHALCRSQWLSRCC